LYQSDPEGREQMDITVLENDHEHIPSILEDLRNSLDIVESIRLDDDSYKQYKYSIVLLIVKKYNPICTFISK
jgi:hypothetical protein